MESVLCSGCWRLLYFFECFGRFYVLLVLFYLTDTIVSLRQGIVILTFIFKISRCSIL